MPRTRLSMRRIREILRLKHEGGLSNRQIARSLGIGRTVVADYLAKAQHAVLGWLLADELDDAELGTPSLSSSRGLDLAPGGACDG